MANAVYPKALGKFLSADLDLTAVDVKVMLVDTDDAGADYQAADEFLADIASGGRVGASAVLTTPTVTGGVFDADDAEWATVTGHVSEAAVVYVDTGDAATSSLLCWMDTFSSGMPFAPNGGGFTLTWAEAGIFSI